MDEIKISGKWSIPNTNFNDFSADLYLDPSKNIINLIAYTLEPIGLYKEFDTIIGKTTYGSNITLYKCYVAKEHIIFGEKRKYNTYIISNYCFYGVSFKSEDKVLFHEVSARFSNLDEWAFFKVFDFKPVKNCDFSLQYKRPKQIKYKVNNETTITIYSNLDAPIGLIVDKEVKVTQKVFVSVKHINPQPLKNSLDIIQTLMDFVSFCTYQVINYIEIFGYNPNHYLIFKNIRNKVYDRIPIYTIGQTGEDYQKFDPRNFLLNLHDLENNFNLYMNNWFTKRELLRPVIDQYLNTINYYQMSSELHFLSLVQALESYHRRTRKNDVINESEHKRRIKSIIDFAPKEHKYWLKERLNFSNEPTLKQRTDELTHDDDDYWIFFRGKNEREKFLTDIKNTRNYFIHYDKRLKNKALNGEELYLACDYLKKIIEYHLLKEIGFSSESIRPKIVKQVNLIRDIFNVKNIRRQY